MEWYFGRDMEDLAVPKDEEMFDMLLSPDSWSQLGKIVGNFNSPKKINVLGLEEFLLSETMFSNAVEQFSPPSVSEGSWHDFCQQSACPHEDSDVQLNDFPIVDEADDIFFHSRSEVHARALEGAGCSANFEQTSSKDDMMAVDIWGGRNHIRDSTDNLENASHFLPEKEPEVEIRGLEEQFNECEDITEEEISMEESVLLELQGLTVQLAKGTRICFRDSLYRLAENFRYQTECSQNGEEDQQDCEPTTGIEPSRLRESEATKSDTNAIDGTVATLLFTKLKFCNPSAASTSGLDAETLQREYQADPCFCHPNSSISSLSTVPGGDAEVPTFGLTNQPLSRPRVVLLSQPLL